MEYIESDECIEVTPKSCVYVKVVLLGEEDRKNLNAPVQWKWRKWVMSYELIKSYELWVMSYELLWTHNFNLTLIFNS